jgi:hypothetical protein
VVSIKKAKAQWVWIKDDSPDMTEAVQARTYQRLMEHAMKILPQKAGQIRIRFWSRFCYIDADEGQGLPLTHLCRLGWEGDIEQWSLGFYTYSHEKYQACAFGSGKMLGTPEEALQIGAVYLG